MLPLAHILLLLAVPYGFALAAWPVIRRASYPIAADALMLAAMLLAGYLARDFSAPVRALIAISGTILLLRVHSYACAVHNGGFREYVHFLSLGLISPHLIYSGDRGSSISDVPRSRQFLYLAAAVLVIPVTWKAAALLIATPWSIHSWLVNHLILAGAFIVIMTAVGQCAAICWQLQGSARKALVDHIFLSRTPAEFWRRWSWPMHLWLYKYVYLPAGGKLHHVRATLLVFLVSGLLHELIAALAIGRVTGHQMLFFMLSAVGVLLSPALERLEHRGVFAQSMGRVVTLSFLVATSSLMFATLHYIYPVYYKHTWLLW
jgi:hypothetical protein